VVVVVERWWWWKGGGGVVVPVHDASRHWREQRGERQKKKGGANA
jgi:hypothetical protein